MNSQGKEARPPDGREGAVLTPADWLLPVTGCSLAGPGASTTDTDGAWPGASQTEVTRLSLGMARCSRGHPLLSTAPLTRWLQLLMFLKARWLPRSPHGSSACRSPASGEGGGGSVNFPVKPRVSTSRLPDSTLTPFLLFPSHNFLTSAKPQYLLRPAVLLLRIPARYCHGD